MAPQQRVLMLTTVALHPVGRLSYRSHFPTLHTVVPRAAGVRSSAPADSAGIVWHWPFVPLFPLCLSPIKPTGQREAF